MSPERTRGLRALAGALGLVALMTLTAPDFDDAPRQWVDLTVGEKGTIRDIALTVTSVETSGSLTVRDTELTSTGVFVVVGVVADALVDPVSFQRVQLETRADDRYEPRSEWISAQPPLTQPGFHRPRNLGLRDPVRRDSRGEAAGGERASGVRRLRPRAARRPRSGRIRRRGPVRCSRATRPPG